MATILEASQGAIMASLVPMLRGWTPITTRRISNGSVSSQAQGLDANNYSTWLLPLTWLISSGTRRCKTTRMITCVKTKIARTLELIIQIISRLGADNLHPVVFFKDEE